ncbi:hypothetical protein [Actinoplanes sp. NPDC089786]|uniref:hypothetical protein n=1 Tax=Actinoplanes sp. NPDC089786 TaxID=3155185 RepID=UPI003448EA40
MADELPVSAWARSHFGEAAEAVRRGVVEALHQSQQRAVLVQEMSGLPSKQPYGGMWPATYQALEEQLLGIEGAHKFRAPRASYNFVVVNERLLLPFRHADTLNQPVSQARLAAKIPQELSNALSAAEPPPDLLSLLGEDVATDHSAAVSELIHLSPATKIIYVPYVAHADGGLVKAWWGEALMQADGSLSWRANQPEELPAAQPARVTGPTAVVTTAGAGPAFNEGAMPTLEFPVRPRLESLPSGELEPQTAAVNDGDA